MKLAIVGTVGVPACYGGFETLVENLLDMNDSSNDITIYCSSVSYTEKLTTYKNAKLKYLPLNANGFQSIPYDIFSLVLSIYNRSESILVLGVSGAIFFPFIRIFTKSKLITNIDGLEWKRSKWPRFVRHFLKISEKMAIKYSHEIVADNSAIADYVMQQYGCKATVIAYGGDHSLIKEPQNTKGEYDLALCRIEPENNVELILKSFSDTTRKLKFIGNWKNSKYGLSMKSKYASCENIDIIDPIYDIETLFGIRQNCALYIHGHSAGGTNPSLVEMMHFNKNILAYDCSYNRATTENKGAYFSTSEDLIALINSSELINNANDMKEIAIRRYTWHVVRKQYLELLTISIND